MGLDVKSVSPTRTYVAMCVKSASGKYEGYYFKKFTLPEKLEDVPPHAQKDVAVHRIIQCSGMSPVAGDTANVLNCLGEVGFQHAPYTNGCNDSIYAEWYFLNVLDFYAYIQGCVAWEDFQNVKEVK
jgi:hypothetical protein